MSAPTALLPTSELVVTAWLKLALPDVGVGTALPGPDDAGYPAVRTTGFVRLGGLGGSPGRYLPTRAPVAFLECWVAPAQVTRSSQWKRAGQLAERLVAATYDPAMQDRPVDLTGYGGYRPARVRTVTALSEPTRVPGDPSDWARVDVDLLLNWVPA